MKKGAPPEWVAVKHLAPGKTQTEAEAAVKKLNRPGFFRLVQMQRVIWAERENATLRLRRSHAGSPKSLVGMRKMFERCGGKYPAAEVQAARRKQKANRP